ncbi:putative adhesin [Streptomyces mauvecolor]|uniref:Adhesin n=1 Tax=Streptomyces mauvecolor TaxID=58345 RepID=A0ABV9UEK5_9ACTN
MSAGDKVREIVTDVTGIEWPAGDVGKLRDIANAWRKFADDMEDVAAAANKAAQALIHNNKGEAIAAFADPFWARYYRDKKGWLQDLVDGPRDLAKGIDSYADAVAEAKKKLDHELEIAGATIAVGTGLAFFTLGISEAAAAAATTAIVEVATTAGIALTTEVATIAGTAFATAAIAGIESVTVDLAVAQPLKIAAGLQGGFSLDEASGAVTDGMLYGGLFGAAGSTAQVGAEAGGFKELFGTPLNLSRNPFAQLPGQGLPGMPTSGRSPFEVSRGSNPAELPSFAEVKQAVIGSNPKPIAGKWPDTDGRYYATRVLEGGRPDGETVLAGHGFYKSGAGDITVPPGTTLSFYIEHGKMIPGLNGVAVEGGSYPGAAVETFHPGDKIPNYTLGPPEALGQGGFTVYENSTTVGRKTSLSDLLKPDMGNVHWAACREEVK